VPVNDLVALLKRKNWDPDQAMDAWFGDGMDSQYP